VTPELASLFHAQDGLATTQQLILAGFSRDAVQHRVGRGEWQRVLPGVVLSASGAITRRQRLFAACLWAGPLAVIDAHDACAWYGLRPASFDERLVHLVVPHDTTARSRDFVVVRRSLADIQVGERGALAYVDRATALITAARLERDERSAIALLSRGLQEGVATVADLVDARSRLGDKWCRRIDRALIAVGVGVRSPAEAEAMRLFRTSCVLPTPAYNVWVDLGDGDGPVCLDALWKDARLVHEVNGRRYHAWGLQFDDMQRRHDRLIAAGLIAMHNSPTRLRTDGVQVLLEVERTYSRYAGLQLPAGVRIIDRPPG
jgi:hypothetical protein